MFSQLQAFTCLLYCANAGTENINELRYRLFTIKKGEVESWQLPPCSASLYKHCLRANYQAAIWRCSLTACPEIPSPVCNGWVLYVQGCHEQLNIDWVDVPPAPEAILQLLSCKCSRVCKLPSCPCLQNGLKCTLMCKNQSCTNQVVEGQDDGLENAFSLENEESHDEWD